HRTRRVAKVVRTFANEGATVVEDDAEAAWALVGKTRAQRRIRANDDTSQKLLHVAIRNALRLVLNRPHGAIQSSHGKEVRKRVIGLLSCLHERFVALFAASDDLEGDVE